MPRYLVITLVVFSFFGCTTGKEASAPSDPAKAALDDAALLKLSQMREETEVGRNMAGRLLQYYGTVDDEQLLAYLNQIGSFVAGYGDFTDRRYMFAVLNNEQVNAFACPGGYILLTLGAVRNARNEAEIAGVMAHEIAHVGHKHMYNTLKKMTPEQIEEANKSAENLKIPTELEPRKRPDPTSKTEAGNTLARYLSGSVGGLSILQAAKAGMSVILEKGLGAELEYEADREGVKYAVRAGYNPPALNDFLCRIDHGMPGTVDRCAKKAEAVAGTKTKTILEKTHPPVDERVANINRLLAELNSKEIVGAIGKGRYEKVLKTLPAVVAAPAKSN